MFRAYVKRKFKNQPLCCSKCKRLIQIGDIYYVRTARTGKKRFLCIDCYSKLVFRNREHKKMQPAIKVEA